jgi:hypothetical protein
MPLRGECCVPVASNYKGFPTKVKYRSSRDASPSDGSRNVFRLVSIATFSVQPWLPSEQGMRTAKLQTVIDAALIRSGP